MVAGRPDRGDAGDRRRGSDGTGDTGTDGGDSVEGLSDAETERSGRAAFLEALRVKRHAKRGVAAGVAVTVLVMFLFDVVGRTSLSPLWYVGLGFVFATSVAGLVALALTIRRAIRLSREL